MPRQRVPTELAKLRGNPGHRALPPVLNVGTKVAIPLMPESLTGAQAKVWAEVAPQLSAAGLLSDADYPMLEALCVQVALARAATVVADKAMAEGDFVIPGAKGGLVANPVFAIQRNAWAQALSLAREFGLTPSARSKLALTGVKGLTLASDFEAKQAKMEDAGLPYDLEIVDADTDPES